MNLESVRYVKIFSHWLFIASVLLHIVSEVIALPVNFDSFYMCIAGILIVYLLSYSLYNHLEDQEYERENNQEIQQKKLNFQSLPKGLYEITDFVTKEEVGTLSNEDLDLLRKSFLQRDLNDNYFSISQSDLDQFIEDYRPSRVLIDFIQQEIDSKDGLAALKWQSFF